MPRNAGVAEPHGVVRAIIPRPCRPGPFDPELIPPKKNGDSDPLPLTPHSHVSAAEPLDGSAPDYTADAFEEYAYALSNDKPKLNTCVDAMKQLIDMRWADFEHAINGSLSTSNFLVDAAVTGLTTSIPLVAPGTKSVLAAISAGLLGTRKNFDEDILYSYSIKTILQQMRTDRAAQGAVIEGHLDGRSTPYRNMYQAESDLFEYAMAGSWDHAMASLTTNIAAQTAACQARLRDQKMSQPTDTLPDGQTPTSTATDPCNAPPPAKPALEPVPITFNNTAIAPNQDAALDQVAALIRAGVTAGTISGVVVTGEAPASEGANAAANAHLRAKAIIDALTNPAMATRNVPNDDIEEDPNPNLTGAARAVISFLTPTPAPSGEQHAPSAKTGAPEPPAPITTGLTTDSFKKNAVFQLKDGAIPGVPNGSSLRITEEEVQGDGTVTYVFSDPANPGGWLKTSQSKSATDLLGLVSALLVPGGG